MDKKALVICTEQIYKSIKREILNLLKALKNEESFLMMDTGK